MEQYEDRDQMEEAVLEALRRKDPGAPDLLVDVFGDRIYGLSLRMLGSVQEAQESVQETFLTIWEKWPSFRGGSRFSTWIYRVAANCAYMRIRRMRRRRVEVSIDAVPYELSAIMPKQDTHARRTFTRNLSPDKVLENKELMDAVDQAINSLSPNKRTAFVLKDVEGMSLGDIAEIMELSESAVRSRVHRARLEVRKVMQAFLDGHADLSRTKDKEDVP